MPTITRALRRAACACVVAVSLTVTEPPKLASAAALQSPDKGADVACLVPGVSDRPASSTAVAEVAGVGALLLDNSGVRVVRRSGQDAVRIESLAGELPKSIGRMGSVPGLGAFLSGFDAGDFHLHLVFQSGAEVVSRPVPLVQMGGHMSAAPASTTEPLLLLTPAGSPFASLREVLRANTEPSGNAAALTPLGTPQTGPVMDLKEIPGFGQVWHTCEGLFATGLRGSKPPQRIELPIQSGTLRTFLPVVGYGLIAQTSTGWYGLRSVQGQARSEEVSGLPSGEITATAQLDGYGSVLFSNEGIASIASANESLTVIPGPELSREMSTDARNLIEASSSATVVLLWKASGPRAVLLVGSGGKLEIRDLAPDLGGPVDIVGKIPGVGTLLGSPRGLFLGRADKRQLLWTLLSSHPWDGAIRNEGLSAAALDGQGFVVANRQGWWRSIRLPLSDAKVKLLNRENLHGREVVTGVPVQVAISLDHPCATGLDSLAVEVSVSRDGDVVQQIKPQIGIVDGKAFLTFSLDLGVAGDWQFQVLSALRIERRLIGPAVGFTITKIGWLGALRQWGPDVLVAAVSLLAAANLGLFVAARWSKTAWRKATSNGLSAWALQLATGVLTLFQHAQLWILDLYFKTKQGDVERPPAMQPLPVTHVDGRTSTTEQLIAGSWRGRRVWVQGRSGMGKTLLFRHAVAAHFSGARNAFAAISTHGGILVPFVARDYAGGGDDKADPAWVLNAIKVSLAGAGLPFEDDKLLHRILSSGTLAIAIDGLHEAGRVFAVDAFARAYPNAPMLVTSQEAGSGAFETWRLPNDMREHTGQLLKLQLGASDGAAVEQRIEASGLKAHIRSGYDVRLISDLVRVDPRGAPLPRNRAELYDAVLKAGWPESGEDEFREQFEQTAAAAWQLVSGRKANEDKRRMTPDKDLSSTLLNLLAKAPEDSRRSIRLVRRVGSSFEFVHDQMHAYLAARWFTLPGVNVAELLERTKASTIWHHSITERRILWAFVAEQLDDKRLLGLWQSVVEVEEWDSLRRELRDEARRRDIETPHGLFGDG